MANIVEITDFSDPALDIYARLTENQLRSGHGLAHELFIAESPNVIHRALDAGYEPVSLLMERKHVEGQAREVVARCGDVPVYTSDIAVLKELTGFPLTRGVLCAMRRRPLPSAAGLCLGARRVAALGVEAVLLTPACTDPLYRRCVRVSMGAVFQVPWAYISPALSDWPHPGLDRLREWGFQTAAMALRDDSLSVADPRLKAAERLAVVLGTEGDGLADETIARCDYTVRIPMSNGVDSLNVAAASAVAFWELCGKGT